jgi:hypothetical protein
MILSILIKNRDFLTTELWKKKEEMKLLKELIEETEDVLREQCKHNWITDYVDDKYGEQSNMIIYCEYCEISLKKETKKALD